MNFQKIREANGNNIDCIMTPTEIGGTEYNQNQKALQKVKFTDSAGETHGARIYQGKSGPLSPQAVGQPQMVSLSSYEGNYQGKAYTGYSGFWNGPAQGSQAAPQATSPAPATDRDACIVRQCAGKVVAQLYAGGGMKFSELVGEAVFWSDWMLSGKKPTLNPNEEPTWSEEGDEEIPF